MRFKTLLVMAILIIISASFAKEARIAYFDSNKLQGEWNDWKDAQAKFDQEMLKWQQDALELEEELTQLMEDYQRQELLLSDDKKQEKEMLIQQKQAEYQEFLASIYSENGIAFQRNAELTAPLFEKISIALSKIAERDGYSVVFDAASTGIAYIDPALDITEELIEELQSTR